ncbi:MAG: hypothetical protein SFX73_25415 [Kofleriaceae bacterium]|nr:hypothetical protein [Kofleriaceae bacterium]
MNAELLAAAAALNVANEGLDERELALAVLAECGLGPDDFCSEHRRVTLKSQGTAYLVMRACRAATEGF